MKFTAHLFMEVSLKPAGQGLSSFSDSFAGGWMRSILEGLMRCWVDCPSATLATTKPVRLLFQGLLEPV